MIDLENKTVYFWKDLLKVDLVNGRETSIYVSANVVLVEAKKQGIDLEKIKNSNKKPVEVPDYNTIVDILGYSPDKGIAELVWLLNSMGITTRQSCEGHPNEKHGSPNPLVVFSESMLVKVLAVIDKWEGVKSGDVVFSRMINDEFGEKNLVEMNFMNKLLVGDFVSYIKKTYLTDQELKSLV